ncbi:hypothetical protein D3C77_611890 [compost metagenome]
MNIPTDMSGLRLVSIDRLAVEPISPVKPNRPVYVAFGLILGGLAGCMIVLLRYAFKKRRRERARITIEPLAKTIEVELNSQTLVRR